MRIKEKYTQMSKEGNEIKKKKTGWGHREEKGGKHSLDGGGHGPRQ